MAVAGATAGLDVGVDAPPVGPEEEAMLRVLAGSLAESVYATAAASGPSFAAMHKVAAALVRFACSSKLEAAAPKGKASRAGAKGDLMVYHQLRYVLNPFFVASMWPRLRELEPSLSAECSKGFLNHELARLRHWTYMGLMARFGVDHSFYETASRPHPKEPCALSVRAVFGSDSASIRARRELEERFHRWRLTPDGAAGYGE
ncbi:hypothetical protein FNF27_02287 [Cafeteria roenbergensis]|uniref:Uncharacterized protein n=1 Tax=Cafeteria roenbergensis TaxID=33653 RepID=A0A5A8DRD9_CAFRO|nr:hypothetical protein FNF29_02436 [Cafeteria roenbergensis]KAA0163387.1 hypothetical protein FNF28_04213 [Cafeteria roenbergensis]KAA0168065.1 hypothetical protein FNF31_00564 [Cafeteria roenbergensis]KAA0176230.1 hypothetical protein FNF27_02287 [Cafeteria roenbergensis]|tara:strand:- start:201 stop:809 length:609 start_codon:yes stop_codon:yes gene_type:complete|eukprot:KAA0154559.1 hypothetical protein FNF29_02436 [Cafeteria roenbergensis]